MLRVFVQLLAKIFGYNIYLVAQGMGNRIMLTALQKLMAQEHQLFRNRHVRKILLTTIDISVADFKTKIALFMNGKLAVTPYVFSTTAPCNCLINATITIRPGRRA